MTQQRISDDALKALIEKATPGPWRLQSIGSGTAIVNVGERMVGTISVYQSIDDLTIAGHAPDLAVDLRDARALLVQKDAEIAALRAERDDYRNRWNDERTDQGEGQ